jgi:hypothetical protein
VRSGGAAWLLALSGSPQHVDDLVAFARTHPSAQVARGLGRFGHIGALGALIDMLSMKDESIVAAAADALDRITGAGLRETVEEPWELGLPPDAREVEGAAPKPTRKVEKPISDPQPWRAWLAQEGARLDPLRKWRGGKAFAPLQIVDELEAKGTPPAQREEAALEYVIATGLGASFSPHDWVSRQKRQLEAMRETASSIGIAPGSWCFAGLGVTARRR